MTTKEKKDFIIFDYYIYENKLLSELKTEPVTALWLDNMWVVPHTALSATQGQPTRQLNESEQRQDTTDIQASTLLCQIIRVSTRL